MKMSNIVFAMTAVSFCLVGCLKTRADLKDDAEDQTPQVQTVAQQKAEQRANAAKPAPPPPPASRFEEYDEQMRQLNGRMDVSTTPSRKRAISTRRSSNRSKRKKPLSIKSLWPMRKL